MRHPTSLLLLATLIPLVPIALPGQGLGGSRPGPVSIDTALARDTAYGGVAPAPHESASGTVAPTADSALGAAPMASPGPAAAGASPASLPSYLEPLSPTAHDSAASEVTRAAAEDDSGLRVVVSIADRRMWTVRGADTLLSAPAAVGMDARLDYQGRDWTFRTPRGVRTVLRKHASPVWIPPDWHYAEVAAEYRLRLTKLSRDEPVMLSDGRRLEVRGDEVGVDDPAAGFEPLPLDEEIVFDSTLFIPPLGTKNRRVIGELGEYQLDLGNGYLLHGTPHANTIGTATTHGCVRLPDDAIAWLYENVPVGTRVYIY